MLRNIKFIPIKKIASLFHRYPDDPVIRPEIFNGLNVRDAAKSPCVCNEVCIEMVDDRYFFLLFAAITRVLGVEPRLVVVKSLNAAVGFGFASSLKRNPIYIWLKTSQWIRVYGRLNPKIAYRASSLKNVFSYIKDSKKAFGLWQDFIRSSGRSLIIDDVEISDLVISSYLRFRPSPRFEVQDKFVHKIILHAMRDSRAANKYFSRNKTTAYLTSYSTYLEHGIPVRTALKHGVTVWSFANLNEFGKKLTLKDSFHTPDFSSYKMIFNSLEHKESRLAEAEKGMNFRINGGVDMATVYMRKSAYLSSKIVLPADLNGAVVIFLHDFYDSPHAYPDLIFDDFWGWTCFTIEYLLRARVNFYIKPHPNQISSSDMVVEKIKSKFNDLKWLNSDVNNKELCEMGISLGITVYGTVANELGFLGVPSLSCARHPHHAFSFSRTAKSKGEYGDLLSNIRSIEFPPPDEIKRESLEFYYMHNLYGSESNIALRGLMANFWKACNSKLDDADFIEKQYIDMANYSEFIGEANKILSSAFKG